MNKLNKKQEKKESKYPYRCGICKAQFHYEQGFDGHMRKHKLGILNKKGLTNAEYKKGYWQNKLSLQKKESFSDGVAQGHFEAGEDRAWYLKHARKEIIEEIEKVLEKGHGGGNWRRLIILVLSRLKNNKAK